MPKSKRDWFRRYLEVSVGHEVAMPIARMLRNKLSPVCQHIEIAGSLRRKQPYVSDIELLCVPRYSAEGIDLLDYMVRQLIREHVLDYRLNKLGRKTYGTLNKLLLHVESGIGIDIFSTTRENWFVALVVRTGPKESNIRISKAAHSKGWFFHAYGSGFTDETGREIVCHSEQEVFELVGLRFSSPENRK